MCIHRAAEVQLYNFVLDLKSVAKNLTFQIEQLFKKLK